MELWDRLDEVIGRVEKILVAILLSFMILTAFFQILLRNFFGTGFSWGDPMVRYLVLWAGFIGATIAVKEGKHINIDVLSRWVSAPGRFYIHAISDFISTFICGLLTYGGLKFIDFEAQMESTTFFEIPVWIPSFIIPLTFGLMTIRFAFQSLNQLSNIFKRNFNLPLE
jgi:TRAP-type C4-dicarboxylate transport system permease small subunit